jgi:hypothetical protein
MAELTFLHWQAPLLPQAAEWLAARFRDGNRIDLSEALLVVPGARAGRRLMELLAQSAEVKGLVLVPPGAGVLTVGRLPEQLYRPPRPLASRSAARRAWARALGESPEELVQVLFPDSSSTSELGGRSAIARTLDALNRGVGAGGKTFSDVARECGEVFSDEKRWRALAEIQVGFWRRLREAGQLDPEEARRLALRDEAYAAKGPIILMGVTDMPGVIRAMMKGLEGQVEAMVHAPEELRSSFDSLGLVNPEAWLAFHVPVPEEALTLEDKPSDQASAVLKHLMGLGGAFSPEEITVGVPDPSVVPYLEQRLGAYGVPYRYAGGFPLSRTSPYRFLEAAAASLSGNGYQALAAILRHPAVRSLPGLEGGPRASDLHFTRHLPATLTSETLPTSAEHGSFSNLLKSIEGPDLLGTFSGTGLLSEWMPKILRVLAEVFGRRTLDPRIPEEGRVVKACLRFREAAQALHDLPRSLDEGCSAPEAIRVLLGEVRDDALPPEATQEALELVGWLELHLDDAPVLLLTGINEPVLPEAVNADPFLPNALRTRLGLEDNRARHARDSYRLTAILHSKEQLRLVAGRRNAGGDPLRPSRLLLTGGAREMARRILRFTSDEGPRTPESELPPLAILPAPTSGFSLPPEPWIAIPELPRPLPVTAFRSLLSDPYTWALERILKLEEVSDQAQELDPLAFGTLAHKVLEVFGASPEAGSSDEKTVRAAIHSILDRIVRDRFGPSPLPTVPLQVEQLRSRLDAFAEWQAGWVGEGWRIHAVEARTIPEGAPFRVDEDTIYLSGRMDRIDFHEERGEWVIFDYKTGDTVDKPEKSHRGRNGWKDLQLPLYRHLLGYLDGVTGDPGIGPDGDTRLKLAYLPLTKNPRGMGPAIASWTSDDLEDADETARDVIRTLLRDGGVSFDPESTGRRAKGPLAALLGRGVFQEVMDAETSQEGGE